MTEQKDDLEVSFSQVDGQAAKDGYSEIGDSSDASLGLADLNDELPLRPSAGPWRDPNRGHGKGKNPVLIIAPRPDPTFDSEGRPVFTRGTSKRPRRPVEREYLPGHGAGFANLHETVLEVCKLFIGAGEPETARLLIGDVQQLTYVGKEQRSTAVDVEKVADGAWQLVFDGWREIDDEHVVLSVPPATVEISDTSATQAAYRSLPDKDTLMLALMGFAELGGTAVDEGRVQELFDRAREMTPEQHIRARELLIALGLERWNERGKLEINAPLLIQGPAGIRKLIIDTLDRNARCEVPRLRSATGTNSGKRKNLPKSVLQTEKIEQLTHELSEARDDTDAVLGKACNLVSERDEARERIAELEAEQAGTRDAVLDEVAAKFAEIIDELRRTMPKDAKRDDVLDAMALVRDTAAGRTNRLKEARK